MRLAYADNMANSLESGRALGKSDLGLYCLLKL